MLRNYNLKKNKKIFIIDGIEIFAAGIIFYRFINKIPYYLLMEMKGDATKFRWEDPGGKTSLSDIDVLNTAAREVSEEFNALFTKRNLETIKTDKSIYLTAIEESTNLLTSAIKDNSIEPILLPKSKYAVYLAPFPEQYCIKNIGLIEINHHDPNTIYTIHRKCKWLTVDNLSQLNMKEVNPRIREFINILISL
jgi:hypothetical protein